MQKKLVNFSYLFVILFGCFYRLYGHPYYSEDLIKDLLLVQDINSYVYDCMPVTYNHFLQGGYINMPSARVGLEGNAGFGYTSLPPYRIYSARLQYTPYLEITGSYRIFRGVPDLQLSHLGFGDFSDKGVNFKAALLRPEDSDYELPGFAFGMDDVLGTRAFKASYIVATKVWLDLNLEASIGYGQERLQGFFAGALWKPLRQRSHKVLRTLTLVTEYDSTNYKDKDKEPHEKGRESFSPWNFGAKLKIFDCIDTSVSYVRGHKWAFSAAVQYDFSQEDGLLLKVDDPPYCKHPLNYEAVEPTSDEILLAHQLLINLSNQGYKLLSVKKTINPHFQNVLQVDVKNCCWRNQKDQWTRIAYVLATVVPHEFSVVVVRFNCIGMPIQEIAFPMYILRSWFDQQMGDFEMQILSPVKDVGTYKMVNTPNFFEQERVRFNINPTPRLITLFGSAAGKFKYAIGVDLDSCGFLKNQIYYSLLTSYTAYTTFGNVGDKDKLNPSQIINVRTDYINYVRDAKFYVDQAFLQKNFSLGAGSFVKTSAGLFEVMYGGAAFEYLYYPVNNGFAFGFEAAYLKKRTYNGFGFTDTIRRFVGENATYVKFNGYQYFLNLYYEASALDIDFMLKLGKFLAHDSGARFEMNKYFASGLEVYLWYTRTNGGDVVNGEIYFDKGVGFSMPIDFFYTRTCQRRFGYGMSAWLRDVGAIASTGIPLYRTIQYERQWK